MHFKTNDIDEKADEDYKINWKDIEFRIKANFDQVKVVYSRSDKYDGHLAISQYKMNKEQFKGLINTTDVLIGTKKFSFSELKGEDLKDFWQKQGGHFQYCIAPKMRVARKNARKI